MSLRRTRSSKKETRFKSSGSNSSQELTTKKKISLYSVSQANLPLKTQEINPENIENTENLGNIENPEKIETTKINGTTKIKRK